MNNKCVNCSEKCPQAELAHNAALGRMYTMKELVPLLKKIENGELAPVVHGRWVNPYMNRYGHPCHCCSVCGFKASYQDKNFCPNCGAKMAAPSGIST